MKLPELQAHHGIGARTGHYREEPHARTDALARMAPAWQVAPMAKTFAAGGAGAEAAAPAQYVYMMSQGIRTSFPSLSVEKAFRQALPVGEADQPINDQMLFNVLGRTQNLYIAREMCWISMAQGTMNYVVAPRSHEELVRLIAAIDPGDQEIDSQLAGARSTDVALSVLIGARGATAPAAMCNGIELPVLMCTRVVNLTWNSMVSTIAKRLNALDSALDSQSSYPPAQTSASTQSIAGDLWGKMYEMANGNGDTDSKRALVYVAVNYMDAYARSYVMMTGRWTTTDAIPTGQQGLATYSLSSVNATAASVQGDRTLIDIIFQYQKLDANYGAGMQQYACTVDVTGLYPFIAQGLSLYVPSPM
jgi:hypothetical protein